MCIYFLERERVSQGGAEREGDGGSEPGSTGWPNVELKLMSCEIIT